MGSTQRFATGATRDADEGKLDYEGFLSPLAIKRYAQYMHEHRMQSDGTLRDSDNWAKGIPRRKYMKSLYRHVLDVWYLLREYPELATTNDIQDALCGVMFNSMGMLHEILLKRDVNS
jgi:hypothetical protein